MAKVYRRPKLYPKQTAAFFEPLDVNGDPARYSWIEGSTENGKTVSCMAWLVEQEIIWEGGLKIFMGLPIRC